VSLKQGLTRASKSARFRRKLRTLTQRHVSHVLGGHPGSTYARGRELPFEHAQRRGRDDVVGTQSQTGGSSPQYFSISHSLNSGTYFPMHHRPRSSVMGSSVPSTWPMRTAVTSHESAFGRIST